MDPVHASLVDGRAPRRVQIINAVGLEAFAGFEFDHNCIYAPPQLPLKFSFTQSPDATRLLDWEQWRQQGKDAHSVLADPEFVDPGRNDYRLRAGSPALKLGFQPIPFDKIGPYQNSLRASWPIVEAEGAREHPPMP